MVKRKKGLKAAETNATLNVIANLISNILAKIVHQRNQLKYCRNMIASFRETFDALFVDIDFSKNLSLSVRVKGVEAICVEKITGMKNEKMILTEIHA